LISDDAIVGLVGVVVGTVSSGGLQFLSARRAEARDRRSAVTLVRAELVHARALIDGANRDPKAWRIVAAPYVTATSWEAFRDRLTRDSEIDIGKLSAAYIGILGIQSMIPLGKPAPAFVETALPAINRAIEHLEDWQEHRGWQRRLIGRTGRRAMEP
jgi:hypothetical protein